MTAHRRIVGGCLLALSVSLALGGIAASAGGETVSPFAAAAPLARSLPTMVVPGAAAAPGGQAAPVTSAPEGTTAPAGTTAPQGTTTPEGTTTPGGTTAPEGTTTGSGTTGPVMPVVPPPTKPLPPPPARITGPESPPLGPSFVGLSVETSLVGSWFSAGGCHSPVQQALAMLGRPEIRVGGDSQDRLWPTAPLPPGEDQVVDPPYLHALHCLSAIDSPLLVGLNLLGQDPVATSTVLGEVASVVAPNLLTIALGNEPDQYGGHLPAPGGYPEYIQVYEQMREALRASFGGPLPQIAGPDPSTGRWITQTASFIATEHPNIADVHVYGLNGCHRTLGSPDYPSIANLLAPGASTKQITALAPVLAAARAEGDRAQISEANSVACGGIAGISDSPASALWGLDLVASAAQAGFSHIELHSSGGSYDPFVLGTDGAITFRPLWTAIFLADQLWPAGSYPLRLSGQLPAGLDGWVARRQGGSLGMLLVNNDLTRSRRLVLATTQTVATLGRLVGSGPQAVTLNGQQLVWSKTGPVWKGTEQLEYPAIHKDRLAVTLAPESAAWIVLGAGTLPA